MKYFFLVFLLSLFGFGPELSGQNTHLHSQISKILKYDTEIEFKETPSFLVGVIDKENFVIEKFGNWKSVSVLSSESCFELGALSKVITVLMLHNLQDKGLIHMDSFVNDYLPVQFRNPRLDDLRIKDLIYFSSGLPNSLVGLGFKQIDTADPYSQYSKIDVLNFYANYVKKDDMIADHYMDLDYALLGVIIENITHNDFQTNLNEHVNKKLGTQFFTTKYEEKADLVVEGMSLSGIWSSGAYFNAFEPSMGIKGSIFDLEKLANHILKLSDYMNVDQSFLTKSHLAWKNNVFAKNGHYVIQVKRNKFIMAGYGHTGIHQVFMGLDTLTQTAVIVLANSSHGTKDLGMLVLRMINDNWNRKK